LHVCVLLSVLVLVKGSKDTLQHPTVITTLTQRVLKGLLALLVLLALKALQVLLDLLVPPVLMELQVMQEVSVPWVRSALQAPLVMQEHPEPQDLKALLALQARRVPLVYQVPQVN